jgi:hypothetical protein
MVKTHFRFLSLLFVTTLVSIAKVNAQTVAFATLNQVSQKRFTNSSQIADGIPVRAFDDSSVSIQTHSPRTATLLAMTLPGAGQIYNRKYWKAPIVYAGLGASIYAIGYYRNNLRTLNDSIGQLYSLGKTPNPLLLEDRDNQRSRRDVAILCLTGVYVLQILDAVVDAHFYKFNINDKIGVEWNMAPSRMLTLHCQL